MAIETTPLPDERCCCGRSAVVAFISVVYPRVPCCGVPERVIEQDEDREA